MELSNQIAKHLRDVHFGGNWTCSNLQDQLNDVSWQESTEKIDSFNTIAQLLFHINYFVEAVLGALEKGKLDAHDKFSFDCPRINSESEWQSLKDKAWEDAENLAIHLEQFPENDLNKVFIDEKYGNHFRNFHGLIEHCHYHLGQIVILKQVIRNSKA